ncbi:50S ribosomal protein L13 [Candidatus Microgenomates bacterium]|nr:50S ribosomal protein L13 [Candidatus Microgenomates bacterium]
MKTYSAKPKEVTRQWYLVDAAQAPLGRMAALIATYLTGKHKAMYTPHIDCGDQVIVINAAKLKLTGNKLTQKVYYRHSGYPGALKSRTAAEQLARDPTKIVTEAVKGMLPKNKLQADRLARLKVYADAKHQHEAQKPQPLEIKK